MDEKYITAMSLARTRAPARKQRRARREANTIPHETIDLLDLEFALDTIQARRYSPESARLLIGYFADQLSDRHWALKPKEQIVLLDYVGYAFAAIMKGTKADVALGLKRGRGQLPLGLKDRNLVYAAMVESEVRNGKYMKRACEVIANRFFGRDKGYKAVRAAYDEYRNILKTRSHAEIAEISEIKREELNALMSVPVK